MHLKLGREVILKCVCYCCHYKHIALLPFCEPLILVWEACLVSFMLNISGVIWSSQETQIETSLVVSPYLLQQQQPVEDGAGQTLFTTEFGLLCWGSLRM